ncbi:MAG: putative cobaltochelatase [Anaerolineae bacterium]
MSVVFPFTAIVGQERMKRALILNAISPQIGGVLIRGERGTAKSTAARALAALLPEIEVVADCPFLCEPGAPGTVCDNCRERLARGERLPVARRRTPFVDLPVSATEDRVVGTLDIERAIQRGERRFEPGVLAAANRGLLYVDEVNLLDDHVVDLLLDSAAMGVNVVEREGISFSHPARFILVGTMNPEEGELRPQLLDRFALCVEIQGIPEAGARADIVQRHLEFERDPAGFRARWEAQEQALSQEIQRARHLLPRVRHSRADLYTIAQVTTEMRVDGHRADIVILKAALAQAAFEGREAITPEDILLAAELALPHRLRRQPFQELTQEPRDLQEIVEQAHEDAQHRAKEDPAPGGNVPPAPLPPGNGSPEAAPGSETGSLLKGHQADPLGQPRSGRADVVMPTGKPFRPRRLVTPLDRLTRHQPGRRSFTRTDRKRGRYVQARPAHGSCTDIALDATVRQAAPHQVHRSHNGNVLAIRTEDLQRKVRVRRAGNLILFVVDASWSMAAAERMTATKGAVLSLLMDAYQKRDRVGLVVFQKEGARVVLSPTSSVERAKRLLDQVPVGGKTPLSSGLLLAYQVIDLERRRDQEIMPLMILLTDGAGNVSLTGQPPHEEAVRLARMIRRKGIRSVVVNMEHAAFDRGLACSLAEALGAPCYRLQRLAADDLYHTVREELHAG